MRTPGRGEAGDGARAHVASSAYTDAVPHSSPAIGFLALPGMGLADGEKEAGIPPAIPAAAGHPQPGLQPRSRTKGLSQHRMHPHPWYLRGDPNPRFLLPRAPLLPHPVVLVGGHRREARLLEDESFEVLLRVLLAVFPGVHVDHVKTRLVSVHGVQNDLNDKTSKETITDPGGAWREESAAPALPAPLPGTAAGLGQSPRRGRGQGHPTGIIERGVPTPCSPVLDMFSREHLHARCHPANCSSV